MADRKIYSEKEATDIILKAAKLQEDCPDEDESESYVPGLTEDELKRMAKELGVEEKYVLRALESRGSYKSNLTEKKALGVVWGTEIERVIDGELPPENFDVVLEELATSQNFNNHRGYYQPVQVGRSLTGPIMRGMAMGRMQLSSRNGRTRLSVKTSAFIPFMTILYPALLFGLIPTAILLGERKVNPAIVLPLLAVFWGLAWIIFTAVQNSSQKKMVEKVDLIAEKVAAETESLRSRLEGSSHVSSDETELNQQT